MRNRLWVIFPVLTLALVLGAALLVPQRGAGAQGPEGTDETGTLGLIDVVNVGPAPGVEDEEVDSPGAQAPPESDGAIGIASHTSGFTYQGRLVDDGRPAEGPYDFRFVLFDAQVGGAQVGAVITEEDVAVTDGLFAVLLDFGSMAFTGSTRYLEISVRPANSTGTFTVLAPRRRITPTPYATFAYNADQLDGRDASSFASASHDHDDRYYRKRSGTQFTGTVDVGQTRSYFTFNWPVNEIVYWSVHPTTAQGRLDWSVDIRRSDDDRFTYYITVTNRGSVATSFEAKYIVFR
jgi:hypothetical protein